MTFVPFRLKLLIRRELPFGHANADEPLHAVDTIQLRRTWFVADVDEASEAFVGARTISRYEGARDDGQAIERRRPSWFSVLVTSACTSRMEIEQSVNRKKPRYDKDELQVTYTLPCGPAQMTEATMVSYPANLEHQIIPGLMPRNALASGQ